MAGEKKNKRKTNYLYVLLLLILIIPTSIMIFLLVMNLDLQKQITLLQQQVMSSEHKIEIVEEKIDDILLYDQNLVQCSTENIDDIQDSEYDIYELENKVVWENYEQTALTWDSNSGIRRVYLTFDDGPSSNTDKILDILNEYGVKATFFVTGKEGYNAQYQRIVNEGHTLGMHSYSHRYKEIYQSLETYKKDLYKIHDLIYEVTGVDSKIARFPGGSSNTVSRVKMQDLISFLNQDNIKYYDWNVSSGDASSEYVSAQTIKANVLNNVWKYDSVVILFHDTSAKGSTVEALPGIIESILASDNTVLLPITDDTVPVQHIKAECQ